MPVSSDSFPSFPAVVLAGKPRTGEWGIGGNPPASRPWPPGSWPANSVALTTGGAVWTWGQGLTLGTGSTTDSTVPVQVPGLAGITQIAAGQGFDFDLALRSDGTVWAWGFGVFGQLGDGTSQGGLTPVQVSGLTGVTQIAAGDGFGLALRSDGTVWGWGANRSGVLGAGVPVDTDSDVPVQVTGLSDVIQIAAGGTSAMAVRVQARRGSVVKTVWTWGNNSAGQLGDGTTTTSAAPVQVSGINVPAVTAISAGGAFSMVLGSDGSVWGWGANSLGQLGTGTTASELRPVKILIGAVTAISAGQFHALVLLRGGTVAGEAGVGKSALVEQLAGDVPDARWSRGRRGEPGAWEHLDEAMTAADRSGEPQRIVPVRLARAELYWLEGKPGARSSLPMTDRPIATRGTVARSLSGYGARRPLGRRATTSPSHTSACSRVIRREPHNCGPRWAAGTRPPWLSSTRTMSQRCAKP